MYALAGKRIWIAGHRGMVGGAIVRRLTGEDCEILTVDRAALDLRDQALVRAWVTRERPDAIVLAAAKVGGILANASAPADFLYDNLMIEANVIQAAYRAEVGKLLFLGSSAVYPKDAAQPIAEEALLTGPLEPAHRGYAIAKIAGLMLAEAYREQHGCDFISAMPTNLYGPGGNFDLATSHFVPALIRKAHEAKLAGADSLTIWGTGSPQRELLHVDDCADACVHLLKHHSGAGHINIGSGEDLTILEIAALICAVVGFDGRIECDKTKPDGAARKLMAGDRIGALGWRSKIALREGLAETYAWFRTLQ